MIDWPFKFDRVQVRIGEGFFVTVSGGVCVTYIPTGFSITCNTERSDHHNKRRALDLIEQALKEKELKYD